MILRVFFNQRDTEQRVSSPLGTSTFEWLCRSSSAQRFISTWPCQQAKICKMTRFIQVQTIFWETLGKTIGLCFPQFSRGIAAASGCVLLRKTTTKMPFLNRLGLQIIELLPQHALAGPSCLQNMLLKTCCFFLSFRLLLVKTIQTASRKTTGVLGEVIDYRHCLDYPKHNDEQPSLYPKQRQAPPRTPRNVFGVPPVGQRDRRC